MDDVSRARTCVYIAKPKKNRHFRHSRHLSQVQGVSEVSVLFLFTQVWRIMCLKFRVWWEAPPNFCQAPPRAQYPAPGDQNPPPNFCQAPPRAQYPPPNFQKPVPVFSQVVKGQTRARSSRWCPNGSACFQILLVPVAAAALGVGPSLFYYLFTVLDVDARYHLHDENERVTDVERHGKGVPAVGRQ